MPNANARDEGVYIGRELVRDPATGGPAGGNKLHYSGGLHQVLFGPSGVGKGMRLLAPNLLQMSGRSIVVIDPKGQLAAMTALHRHQMGNTVKIVDPFGVIDQLTRERPSEYGALRQAGLAESAGYNPLASLDPGGPTFYEDAALIAEALVKVEGTSEPHWPESARGLVTALVMWEREHFGGKANLEHVRQMLTERDEFEDVELDGEAFRVQQSGLRFHAEAMARWGSFGVQSLGGRFSDKKWSDEIYSIRSTADTQTRWMISDPLRRDMKRDGVDFGSLKTAASPTTVYVILPSIFLETHNIWLRLVISDALRANMTMQGRDVLVIMDEFPALDHLSIVQRLWGVSRDYGLQMWAILQDLEQLKKRYPNGWNTMLSSSGIVQSFRVGDMETADWLSKRSARDTVTALGFSQGSGSDGKPSNSISHQQIEKPTIDAHSLFGLPDEVGLAYIGGQKQAARLYLPHIRQLTRTSALALPNPYYKGFQFTPPHLAASPRRLS